MSSEAIEESEAIKSWASQTKRYGLGNNIYKINKINDKKSAENLAKLFFHIDQIVDFGNQNVSVLN